MAYPYGSGFRDWRDACRVAHDRVLTGGYAGKALAAKGTNNVLYVDGHVRNIRVGYGGKWPAVPQPAEAWPHTKLSPGEWGEVRGEF